MTDRLDRETFAAFVRENQTQFYRLAYGYVHDPDTALDLVQDAVLKALQKLDGLRHPEYLRTWFYRVLVNECISHLRKNRQAALPLLEDVAAAEPEEKPDPAAMMATITRITSIVRICFSLSVWMCWAFFLLFRIMSPTEICADLNARGLRTSRGVKFNKNSLRTVLRNERYVGVYKYGDVRIEGGIPAIITRETFDMAQEIIAKNAKAPAASWSRVDYLLTGRLFCGRCGSAM